MVRLRIAFLGLSPMLVEILEATLGKLPEVDLVGSGPGAQPPDLLIARAGSLREQDVVDLLYDRPRLRVLSLEDRGRRASLIALSPERTDLGELSPGRLVDLVRDRMAS